MSIRSRNSSRRLSYLHLNVQHPGELETVFETIAKKWGTLDTVLHSIAFAPKEDLQGRVVDCSKDGFSDGNGTVVLVLYSDGEIGRATDEGRWNFFSR